MNYLHERQGSLLLFGLLIMVPLTWWALIGWRPPYLLDQHDNLQMGYIYFRDLIDKGGNWQQLMYWPGLQGGVKVHDVVGSPPFAQLLAYLGFSTLSISNLSIFFIQVLFAYFSTISVLRLATLVFGNTEQTPLFVLIVIGLIFAFLPLLGWRLTYGHTNIIFGLFVFLCMTTLLLEEITHSRSLLTVLLSVLALTHAFQFNGYQMVYYSVLFGGPVVYAVLFAKPNIPIKERFGFLTFPVLIFFVALLISLPKFAGIAANAFSQDMGRSAYNEVIYGYTTATLADWISSVSWSASFISDERPAFLHQEVNYPLGPLILMLFLTGFNQVSFRLLMGLGASLVLAMIVSMNITPVSTVLVDYLPLLESFRVPARAIMPVIIFATLLGAAALLTVLLQAKGAIHLWLYPVLIALIGITSYNDSVLNDLLLCMAILLIAISIRENRSRKDVVLVCLVLFVGSAISAFHERINPPLKNPISEAVSIPIKQTVFAQAPVLSDPLHRAYVNFQLRTMGFNSAYYIGISTLSGYWFPLGRFGRLYSELNGLRYNPAVAVFNNSPQLRSFHPLNQLYNVGWLVESVAGELRVRSLEPTLGPAWISGELKPVKSIGEVAETLIQDVDKTIAIRRWQALVDINDPVNAGFDFDTIRCESADIMDIRTNPDSTVIEINLANKGTCLLTVATNFAGSLKAYDGYGFSLETLVTYGSLLGVVLPDNTTFVAIRAEAWIPLWSKIAFNLGWILLLILMFFYKYYPRIF
ncbi:MAG: hypothetical protein O6945_09490 [Gammaproteobacteria bacterium]|nr:hypothetical protein [Gammaproteobacteria bacterium]